MGIYKSGLSCFQRRKLGISQDHAGDSIIDGDAAKIALGIKKAEKVEPKKVAAEIVELFVEEEVDLSAAVKAAAKAEKALEKEAKKEAKAAKKDKK